MTPQPNTPNPDNSNKTSPPTSRHEHPVSDETIEKVLNIEDTLIKKPSTFDLKVPPDLKRETRYGDALTGKTAQLIIIIRGHTSKSLEVEVHDTLTIGRTATKAQTRPDLDLNRYGGFISGVSRQHLRITKDADILTVTDLDSRNGTYLNGVRLIPNQPRILRDGDELCLGTLFLRIYFKTSALNPTEGHTEPSR